MNEASLVQSIISRLRSYVPTTRQSFDRRLAEQDRTIRALRRRISALERAQRSARPARTSDERREFRLMLPSAVDGKGDSLDIRLPSTFYVPQVLEETGLGSYERSTLACWLAILSMDAPGAAFDVGANVGVFAWVAARAAKRTVVAFEPTPSLVTAMESVATDNQLSIEIEAIALGADNGTATLHLSDQTDSSNSLAQGFRRSSNSIDVPLSTLDAYVARTERIPLVLKLDTETTEPDIIVGAHDTLTRHRPWLIVEVLAGRTEERLTETMRPFGYHWFPIDDRNPLVEADTIVGDPTYQHSNWLFAPEQPSDELWAEMNRWSERLGACVPTR